MADLTTGTGAAGAEIRSGAAPGAATAIRPGATAVPRPRAAVTMQEGELLDLLLPSDLLRRLAEHVDLVPVRPSALQDPSPDLARSEVLILGWGSGTLNAEALARFPHLRLVVFAGGSAAAVLDAAAADAAGIARSNAGAANAVPVAEFALAAVLLAGTGAFGAREVYRREQRFLDREARMGDLGTYRMQVGVVGASRIGRRVLELLAQHEVELLLHDPTLSAEEARALGCTPLPLLELMARADVVTLHAPSTPATRGMIGAAELAALRDGATVVNTARGELIDQEALVDEVSSGRIRAVLDVTTPDPLPAGHPLYASENVFLTPHVAGSLGRDLRRMGEMVVAEVERHCTGRPLAWRESPELSPTM